MAAERHRARPRTSYPGFTRLSCDIRDCRTAIDGDDAATARRVGRLMGWVRDPIFKTDLCPAHADLAPAAASPGATTGGDE